MRCNYKRIIDRTLDRLQEHIDMCEDIRIGRQGGACGWIRDPAAELRSIIELIQGEVLLEALKQQKEDAQYDELFDKKNQQKEEK